MNYKKIGLLLVAVSVLLNAYFLKDYVFKKKNDTVKVEFECKFRDSKKDEVSRHIETYRFKDNRIYSTYEKKDGKVVHSKIRELKDCIIVDSQNWTCGGKVVTIGSTTFYDDTSTLNNGKFSFEDSFYTGNENPLTCNIKQID